MFYVGKTLRVLGTLLVLTLAYAGSARASATLLLEEPYGKLGFFTATGHSAVYLSGVCAETPLVLRRCDPGELGAVISRYDGVGSYDWIAIPLIPYLYAVEQPEDVPLFVDGKMVNFLRDQYRRKHLEAVASDKANGQIPGGNWYELVGTSYDRAVYAFQIETTAAQDEAFIRKYNSSPNHSHFRTVSSNCADFSKDVINFYLPRALHRSVIADIGITTPKQMAKTLIKYSAHHPQVQFSRFVIPQIPGSVARSTPVHGVVESFFKAKKYIVPSAVASPIFAGCVAAVFVSTNPGHFDPARGALIFNAQRELEPPLGAEDRRSYQLELNHLAANEATESHVAKAGKWAHLFRNSVPDFDAQGRPVFRIQSGEQVVSVGISPSNILENVAAARFTEELLEARLHAELRHGSSPKVSESDVARDWDLLQKSRDSYYAEASVRMNRPLQSAASTRSERAGNRP
ncbi:MAG: hypothetical protein JWQ87_3063 [Candidatus Sulfotelmatobacter sp.]|nr:hypothetical protein [Candidatus Sulfotelmatobacter sp.]